MNISADRSFQFGIGRYLCCVTGSRELIDCLPAHWEAFRRADPPSYDSLHIHLEEAAIGYDGSMADGWCLQDSPEGQQVVYVRKRRAAFALRSGQDQEMVIRVEKALDGYVRSGIHYGILSALNQDYVGLHGVTLLCGDEIVILSAPSGTGKTTLASLLEQYYDAIVINGDFALLNPTADGVFFEPTPFCGTSGRCLNQRVRVNRLVFLEQSPDNRWHTLKGREAMAHFMSNAFVPPWDKDMQLAAQEKIMECISGLRVNLFSFAPTREAAELFSVSQ